MVRHDRCKWLNYEGEVVIVIGRPCRNISPSEAGAYIAGYTIGNDFGLHGFRNTDAGSMLRVKGSDTLCPVGPGLVTDWDFHGKRIRTLVNGEVRQDDSTDEMTWDMHYLVADLARTITLLPGDGVTVEVEGLGSLTNTIVHGPVAIPRASDAGRPGGDDREFRGLRPPNRI